MLLFTTIFVIPMIAATPNTTPMKTVTVGLPAPNPASPLRN